MRDLIEKLEALDGPSRDVDARIAVAAGDVIMRQSEAHGYAFFRAPVNRGDWAFLSNCKNGEEDAFEALGRCLNVKSYTASLDEAIALVERPGWAWTIMASEPLTTTRAGGTVAKGPFTAFVNNSPRRPAELDAEYEGLGATPAIALLIALLRAKEARRHD